MTKQAVLTGLPAALKYTLQDQKEGESEAMHGDHAVERSCQHKNGHCHFPSIESAGSDLGEGGSSARAAV